MEHLEELLEKVQPLRKEKDLKTAVYYIQSMGFFDFLDFCVDHKCFDQNLADDLFDEIAEFDDDDPKYWEEDVYKLNRLYDAIGVTEEIFDKYCE